MTKTEAIEMLNKWGVLLPSEASEAVDMAIEALSEPSGDLISRADAIEAVCNKCPISFKDKCEWKDNGHCSMKVALEALPSAEAEQVTGKLKNPCDSLLTEDSEERKEQKSKLDLISRELAMERIANDNVVGGMERIKEYNNSIEFNDYLDGISDAITTIFCDLPSAEAVQGEWVRKEKEINDCDGHRAFYWYECDQCGARPPKDQWKNEWHSNFCPNCGARMYKGGEDE